MKGGLELLMSHIKSRIVLHFPGFEPLDARQHLERFNRASALTVQAWKINIKNGSLGSDAPSHAFKSKAHGPNWETNSNIHILDISNYLATLDERPFWIKLFTGYLAFFKVIAWGGAWQYFRHAWRFGLFFLFPFLVMTIGICAALYIVFFPILFGLPVWTLALSVLLAVGLFKYLFLPASNKAHTMLLFSDWKCATDLAQIRDPDLTKLTAALVSDAKQAMQGTADEYLIVSHSIGAQFAVQTIGTLLEQYPALFENKTIVFATVGSGLLQTALLMPAKEMRRHISAIADHENISWFDVQCRTDVVNFYGAKVAQAAGYNGTREPKIINVRVRAMLEKSRYKRVKHDLMRVHRQYIMGNDHRANFDFPLLCAGPLPANSFAHINLGQLAPIDEQGAV